MNAIIFAAGLGTRLKPLTNSTPKALVLLNGKPLLWHSIQKLESYGVERIVVNVHHHADKIKQYLANNKFKANILISDETDELLDTGGGLFNAKNLFDYSRPIIAINVDVITSLNFTDLIDFHRLQSPLVTLVVRQRNTSRYLLFNNKRNLCGWKNISTGETILTSDDKKYKQYAFSGIHVISPSIFSKYSKSGKFSIIKTYLELSENNKIKAFVDTSDFWLDLGKPGQIVIAENYLNSITS